MLIWKWMKNKARRSDEKEEKKEEEEEEEKGNDELARCCLCFSACLLACCEKSKRDTRFVFAAIFQVEFGFVDFWNKKKNIYSLICTKELGSTWMDLTKGEIVKGKREEWEDLRHVDVVFLNKERLLLQSNTFIRFNQHIHISICSYSRANSNNSSSSSSSNNNTKTNKHTHTKTNNKNMLSFNLGNCKLKY